jgi:LacI family transcriptional regulator
MVGIPREPANTGLDVYVWVCHPISDHASLMFIKGVSLCLKGTPYRMIVREPTRFFGDYVPLDERQFFADLIDDQNVAGAIVQRDPCGSNAEVIGQFLASGKPLVFVDTPPPKGIETDFVGSANRMASQECVEHLLELGHRRIACLVDNDEVEVTRERMAGYWRAMRQAGLEESGLCLAASQLPPSDRRMAPSGRFAARCATHGAFLEWAKRLVTAVLSQPERPTALVVGCDVLAHSVGALLEGAGVKIPTEMSIVGFDWLGRWESASLDDLTTASQDFLGFGRHAASLLLDRLSGERTVPRHVLLPAPLVVRSSTAPRTSHEPPADPLGSTALATQ